MYSGKRKHPSEPDSDLEDLDQRRMSTSLIYESDDQQHNPLFPEELDSNDDTDSRASFDGVTNIGIGVLLETFNLYRTDKDSPWDDLIPEDIAGDPEQNSEAQTFALIVRQEKNRRRGGLVLHSITVQNPFIRKFLGCVFDGYEGITTKLKELTFYAPFHEFYYRWQKLQKLYLEARNNETREHLNLFISIIHKEIMPHIETIEDLTRNGVISFEYLWAIFPPGLDIYSKVDNQDRPLKVKKIMYSHGMDGNSYFMIRGKCIDCDGTSFGYLTTSVTIKGFEGVKKITDLNAVPSHLHPDVEKFVEKLQSRGKQFEDLNSFHVVSYSGFYIDRSNGDSTSEKRHTDSSRIIIDPRMFIMYNGSSNERLESLESSTLSNKEEKDRLEGALDQMSMKSLVKFEKIMRGYEEKFENDFENSKYLTPRQRMICSPTVRGFSLASKKWAEFYIDNINPIEWSKDAFQRLVLPSGYKQIIHAFVKEQLSPDQTFDDIVRGKGQGFIMLLSGEPGVGKTLTVESVAEDMRKPLYSMSAGELGGKVEEIERNLETVLELTSKWGAILLLDECDIFLERRTSSDIAQNRLVSLFLKQLEYYRGVMFLTTNRASDLDPAFESRIHLAINYPNLDFQSRLHIWQTFTRPRNETSQYPSEIDDSDLETLAKNEMNGRQIKNVVKTARLLAKQKNVPLAMEHVELVLRVKAGGTM